jgi:hypothetical protein
MEDLVHFGEFCANPLIENWRNLHPYVQLLFHLHVYSGKLYIVSSFKLMKYFTRFHVWFKLKILMNKRANADSLSFMD